MSARRLDCHNQTQMPKKSANHEKMSQKSRTEAILVARHAPLFARRCFSLTIAGAPAIAGLPFFG
jgi:hypothetical protein